MIRLKILILSGIVSVLFSCNEIDNYNAPNGDIYGKLTDKITTKQLQSEEPNGFTIKLFEKGGAMNSPIAFQGKPDGTFENAMIFQNEYKVLATEGAFFYVDTVKVQVGSRTEVNFEVVPFLAVINASVTASAGKITANYKIARSQVGDKIIERRTLVSLIPTVNNVTFKTEKKTNINGLLDTDILNSQFTDDVTGLTSGKYYVRIAVRTNNALKKYNYSEIFPVTVP
jgi:hypothetical protein